MPDRRVAGRGTRGGEAGGRTGGRTAGRVVSGWRPPPECREPGEGVRGRGSGQIHSRICPKSADPGRNGHHRARSCKIVPDRSPLVGFVSLCVRSGRRRVGEPPENAPRGRQGPFWGHSGGFPGVPPPLGDRFDGSSAVCASGRLRYHWQGGRAPRPRSCHRATATRRVRPPTGARGRTGFSLRPAEPTSSSRNTGSPGLRSRRPASPACRPSAPARPCTPPR